MADSAIYLDHAATTPADPRVVEAMLPFFTERFGNPSSIYGIGRDARAALDYARASLAKELNCHPREFVITSGATEANNLAIKGVAWWNRLHGTGRHHIVTTAIEHHAVLHAVAALAPHGFESTFIAPGPDGIVSAEAVDAAIRDDTCLVSVMHANNEIGTIQPVADIAAAARRRGITMHCDAVQSAGYLDLNVEQLGVDLLTLSAHKFYGPKGVGLLYVRRDVELEWQQLGGGQENTRRGGTENVPGIVGMATALELAAAERESRSAHACLLRDRLFDGILERVPCVIVNGHRTERLPNNVNVSFEGVNGETVLLALDFAGVAASSGSACSTGSTEPSHVLLALGHSPELAGGSLRLTVGTNNTPAEIDRAIEVIADAVARVRDLAEFAG